MTKEEKLLCNYMSEFFQDNFEKITYDLSDSELPIEKNAFLKIIKNDPQTAMWSLGELCMWGMGKKEYLKELYYGDQFDNVLKINDTLIKVQWSFSKGKYEFKPYEIKQSNIDFKSDVSKEKCLAKRVKDEIQRYIKLVERMDELVNERNLELDYKCAKEYEIKRDCYNKVVNNLTQLLSLTLFFFNNIIL